MLTDITANTATAFRADIASRADIDADALWATEQKADRLLCRLPAETIGYLGDDFPWTVDDEDVRLARLALSNVRLAAILLGRELAQMADGEREAFAATA